MSRLAHYGFHMTTFPAIHFSNRKALCTFMALAVAGLSLTAHAQGPAIVGEATMVIGVAKLIGVDGVTRQVERGTTIRVGERIQTQSGGHVHLRFVDGGRLSIRPSSNLQIEDYSHSAQQPLLGAIKFRLDEGVVRSITGNWGEAARDRFRLNTPVAAIGVKGTDFVVKSEGDKTTASVYTGAIAFTPLVGVCASTVGPCLNGFEKVLSEDMKGQMVEVSRRQTTPQLVPLTDLLARNTRSPVQSASADVVAVRIEKTVSGDDNPSESRAVKTVVIDNQAVSITAAPAPAPVAVAVAVAVVAVQSPMSMSTAPTVSAPAASPPQVNQLLWSRYIWVQVMDGDTFTKSLGQALAVADYERFAGNGNYLMFRPTSTSTSESVVTTQDTLVNFRLANSTAQLALASGKPSESVSVNDGSLSVDFTRSTFATRLGLSSKTIGTEAILANGVVTTSGMLRAVTTNAVINGALTLDGKEAGYAFDKAIPAGNLRGVTLWGR